MSSWGTPKAPLVPPAPGRAVDMEEQLILRVPQQMADQIRKMLRAKQFNEDIEFKFADDGRHADFKLGNRKFDAYLLDLPCILESHKTLDKTTYYKSADIGQVLLVPDPNKDFQVPQDYKLTSGLNPPTKDIRRRKWRKPVDKDKMIEMENEVLRLLKPSENETIEIINPEDCTEEELNGIVETSGTKDTPAPKEKRPSKKQKQKKAGDAVPDKGEKSEKSEEGEAKSGQQDKKKPKGVKKERVKKEKVKKVVTDKDAGPEKEKKHRRKRQKPDTEAPPATTATATTTPITQPAPITQPTPLSQPPSLPTSMPFPFAAPPTNLPPAVIPPTTRTVISPIPEVAPIPPPVIPQQAINTSQTIPIAATIHPPTAIPIPTPAATATTTTTPAQIAPPAKPLIQETPEVPQPIVSAENAALLQQHKKLAAEVASLRARVADAEANVKKAPNPVIKGRASGKLAEANEALKTKLDELAAVEASLAECRK